jgi:hypothetical protein
LTFDGFSYTFGGLGQYLLTETNDNTFQIQIQTTALQNTDDPTLSASFISSVAIKKNLSSTVQVSVKDPFAASPLIRNIIL